MENQNSEYHHKNRALIITSIVTFSLIIISGIIGRLFLVYQIQSADIHDFKSSLPILAETIENRLENYSWDQIKTHELMMNFNRRFEYQRITVHHFKNHEIISTLYEKPYIQPNPHSVDPKFDKILAGPDTEIISGRKTGFKKMTPDQYIFVTELNDEENSGKYIVVENKPVSFSSMQNVIFALILALIAAVLSAVSGSTVYSTVIKEKSHTSKLLKTFFEPYPNFRKKIYEEGEYAAIQHYTQTLFNIMRLSSELKNSLKKFSKEIMLSSKSVLMTSEQQKKSINKITETVQNAGDLSEKIRKMIKEMANISNQTTENVKEGFNYLTESRNKMENIKNSNKDNIDGIKALGSKIENIWDIVSIINNIADQTKIIAFNAELQAAEAGTYGKNFKIVANEVRRLANNTVESTREIKNRISEIQHSSDHLILASEEGTSQIEEGWNQFQSLEKVFDDILESSEVSTTTASQISQNADQQVEAFGDVSKLVKSFLELESGFNDSTENLANISEYMKADSKKLDEHLQYLDEE